jgi:sugar (pentulose or hexulose) kinase
VKEQLFPDLTWPQYKRLMKGVARRSREASAKHEQRVIFDPYLAGDRTSIDQPTGAFRGLTLSTTRDDMLEAVVDALALASAGRLDLLKINAVKMNRRVVVSGGVSDGTADLMHRDWPGKWSFRVEAEATLRGLAKLGESME